MRRFGTAFTMIELTVVTVAIGILAAIVVPKFATAQSNTSVAAAGEDILALAQSLDFFYTNKGYWPAEVATGTIPPEISTLFKGENPFGKPCPIGSLYDYDSISINNSKTILISLLPTPAIPGPSIVDAQALDAYLDDGVLNTGRFQASGNGYAYRISK